MNQRFLLTNQILFSGSGEAFLRAELEAHKRALAQANTEWDRLRAKPAQVGTVSRVLGDGRGMLVSVPGSFELKLPEGCKVGTQVRLLLGENGPIALEPYAAPILFGLTVTVDQVVRGDCLFQLNGADHSAALAEGLAVKLGDRVRLDPTGSVALESLGPSSAGYAITSSPGVSWDDIGGQEAAKEVLREAIEYPVKYRALYSAYQQEQSRGVLLYGPPGCGKTMLGKAVATAISADLAGFIYVKGPEILTKFRGEPEGSVRALFNRARAYRERTGVSAVIFIDEAEAVLSARGLGGINDSSLTIVPAFLNEMGGLDDAGAFVLLATNRPDILDPAVIREGRIDRKARVERPDQAATKKIFELAMRGRPCEDLDALAERATALMFSDELALYEVRFHDRGPHETVRLRHALSGAVVVGVVQRATNLAIKRDREAGACEPTGITRGDVEDAIRQSHRELAGIEQPHLIEERCAELGRKPSSVEKSSERSSSRIIL